MVGVVGSALLGPENGALDHGPSAAVTESVEQGVLLPVAELRFPNSIAARRPRSESEPVRRDLGPHFPRKYMEQRRVSRRVTGAAYGKTASSSVPGAQPETTAALGFTGGAERDGGPHASSSPGRFPPPPGPGGSAPSHSGSISWQTMRLPGVKEFREMPRGDGYVPMRDPEEGTGITGRERCFEETSFQNEAVMAYGTLLVADKEVVDFAATGWCCWVS